MANNKQKRHRKSENEVVANNVIPIGKRKKKFVEKESPNLLIAMTPKQGEYLGHLRTSEQVFVLGPAGTGKTWVAASYAADLYRSGVIRKIILTRPNVSCGRSLGFFPGTLEAKFAPWAAPITDAIRDRIGTSVFDIALKNGDIEIVPFEVMRGRSWKNSFILLDEAQNTSVIEMKMFLTRIGEHCISVINGDIMQCDLPSDSGLKFAIEIIRSKRLPIPIVEFELDDIVRSGLCAIWVRAFS